MRKSLFVALVLSCLAGVAVRKLRRSQSSGPSRRGGDLGHAGGQYDLMLQEMLTKTAGKVKQVVYWGRPLDWQNQTLTPNPDALYFMSSSTPRRTGRSRLASRRCRRIVQRQHREDVADAARRCRAARRRQGQGRQVCCPATGLQGSLQKANTLQSDTFGGYVLFRSNLKSHADADVAKIDRLR